MHHLSDPRFLQAFAIIALLLAVLVLMFVRHRRRRREESRSMRIHFLDTDRRI